MLRGADHLAARVVLVDGEKDVIVRGDARGHGLSVHHALPHSHHRERDQASHHGGQPAPPAASLGNHPFGAGISNQARIGNASPDRAALYPAPQGGILPLDRLVPAPAGNTNLPQSTSQNRTTPQSEAPARS